MKDNSGYKSGTTYTKPLGQKKPRDEVKGQRPAKTPNVKGKSR